MAGRELETTNDDRGQAFTLEGIVSALVLVMAVLFALQAIVITPTTGGAVDRSTQAQIEQEIKDTLIVAENDGQLSELVRYWNEDERGFHNNVSEMQQAEYNHSTFAEQTDFGEMLNDNFVNRTGSAYNVDLFYLDEDGNRERINVTRMGGGQDTGAVSASYTVTLLEDDVLTEPQPDGDGPPRENGGQTLEDAESDGYPIPNAGSGDIYNVVEVRVTVW